MDTSKINNLMQSGSALVVALHPFAGWLITRRCDVFCNG